MIILQKGPAFPYFSVTNKIITRVTLDRKGMKFTKEVHDFIDKNYPDAIDRSSDTFKLKTGLDICHGSAADVLLRETFQHDI